MTERASMINFKIASPERMVFEGRINQVSLPTKLGEITILPHHLPVISSLVSGEVKIVKEEEEISMAISGGFVEITPLGVTILADTAERSEEIDIARAQEAQTRAQELLKEKRHDTIEYTALLAKIEKELARIRVAQKRRRRSL